MHSTTFALTALLAASSSALVFPRKQDPAAVIAGGGVPNTGAPTVSQDAITSFQAINFLENMESAFFLQALHNLTAWNTDGRYDRAIDVVARVQTQEIIHVQDAIAVLKANKARTFAPCKYIFPVTSPPEFFALANIITSVGIGAVIDVAANLAKTDPAIVAGPASILAVEARHDTFFRQMSFGGIPNPTPFDTRISALYALSLASPFIVPGSCGSNTPSFAPIPAMKALSAENTTGTSAPLLFTIDTAHIDPSVWRKPLSIGWINQANVVVYTALVVEKAGIVETKIPEGLGGLAFAVLTGQAEALDVNSLTPLTIAGPAPVQIS